MTSANLFYVQFFEGATHRIEFTNESLSLIEIFKNELFSILKLSIDLNDLKDFPYLILTYTSIIFLFFIKNKIAKKIFFFIIFLYTISIVSKLAMPFVSGFRLSWFLIYEKNLYVFLVFFYY